MKEYSREVFAERLNKLAKDLGLSNASISYWENGKQEPSASALFKLSVYFEVSVDYLIGTSEYR